MGRQGLDGYATVASRLEMAQTKLPSLTVQSKVEISWTEGVALVKVTLKDGDKILAEAHALAPDLSDEKSLEKTETTAVGRALAFMGYPAKDDSEQDDEDSKPRGLGGKRSGLPKKSARQEEADDSEDQEDEEEESEKAAPAPKKGLPGLGKRSAAPEKQESDDEEEESEADEGDDSDDSDESEEEAAPAKGKPASSKLNGVMAKYGLK